MRIQPRGTRPRFLPLDLALGFIVMVAMVGMVLAPHQTALAQGQGVDTRTILGVIMAWGERYFPLPDWTVQYNQNANTTEGVWLTMGRVVSHKRWHLYPNLPIETVTQFADPSWLQVTFSGYSDVEITRRCVHNRRLHLQATATFADTAYTLNYWLWSDSVSLAHVFTAHPTADTAFPPILETAIGTSQFCGDEPLF